MEISSNPDITSLSSIVKHILSVFDNQEDDVHTFFESNVSDQEWFVKASKHLKAYNDMKNSRKELKKELEQMKTKTQSIGSTSIEEEFQQVKKEVSKLKRSFEMSSSPMAATAVTPTKRFKAFQGVPMDSPDRDRMRTFYKTTMTSWGIPELLAPFYRREANALLFSGTQRESVKALIMNRFKSNPDEFKGLIADAEASKSDSASVMTVDEAAAAIPISKMEKTVETADEGKAAVAEEDAVAEEEEEEEEEKDACDM